MLCARDAVDASAVFSKKEFRMHSDQEYRGVLGRMLQIAQRIAEQVEREAKDTEAREILRFCIRHGYIGYPLSQEGITCGGWLVPGKHGGPTTEEAEHALAIVVCFEGDPIPSVGDAAIRQKGTLTISRGGFVSQENRLLVITSVNRFSSLDLAMVFLHEARHARDHFGERFEGLAPLDPPDLHEVRTWEFALRVLDICGGEPWHDAVRLEAERLLVQLTIAGRKPGNRWFGMSNIYDDRLDRLFGPSPHPAASQQRNLLVAVRALFLLAERTGIPDAVAHRNIVERYYAWAHE